VETKNGTNLEDRHLVNQVLHGDRHAFKTIVKNTENLVAQIIFKMIDNPEDRRDLAQDVYLKVYKSLPGFRFGSKLSTWIGQVAYNTCLDHLQKKKLFLPGDLHQEKWDEEPEGFVHDFFIKKAVGETDLLRKERSQILKQEIESLPPVYKTLIFLFHQEEMSYEEITRITGLPEGTVKSYLFRARKTLKDHLLATYKKEDL